AQPAKPALVTLGPHADPAWASWVLRWDAGDLGQGVVVVPHGDHLLVGRDPDADLVVHIEQISWHHLELAVQHDGVTVMDLGSRNGTWLAPQPPRTLAGAQSSSASFADPDAETPLPPRSPTRLPAWQGL